MCSSPTAAAPIPPATAIRPMRPICPASRTAAGESWDMWKAIAAQAEHGEYGNPDSFCSDIDATNWMSATVATSDEEVIRHIMDICKRDPRSGKVTTGGIVTVKDSTDNWYLSWTINRQPQFKSQDKNMVLVWLYSLNTNTRGQLCEKGYARLHRRRGLPRMAVSHRRADRQDRRSGARRLQHHDLLHAVYQRLLPAAQGIRPSEGRAGRRR